MGMIKSPRRQSNPNRLIPGPGQYNTNNYLSLGKKRKGNFSMPKSEKLKDLR